MIGVGCGMDARWVEVFVVEEQADIGVKRLLIALERKRVIAALIHNLSRDRALAIERVRCDNRALQGTEAREVSEQP